MRERGLGLFGTAGSGWLWSADPLIIDGSPSLVEAYSRSLAVSIGHSFT